MSAGSVEIPMDIYESPKEIVIVVPLGGVSRKSLDIMIDEYKLIIKGERVSPIVRDDLSPLEQNCYRGIFEQTVHLPPNVYFDKIHSKLSTDNILSIVVPKSVVPEKIKLEVELH